VSAVVTGFALARERLRGNAPPVVLALGLLTVAATAVLERRSNAASAPDDVLSGAAFGIALPLFAYFVSERACDGQRLDHSVDGVARYGANRRAALLGVLLASALGGALCGALLAIFAVLGAHSPHSNSLVSDLRASVGIALIAGSVYALYFGAASLVGKRGGGRKWALIIDFVFGAGSSALALPWPRAHVRNLIGGVPVVDLSQTSAWFALVLIGGGCVALSVLRTPE